MLERRIACFTALAWFTMNVRSRADTETVCARLCMCMLKVADTVGGL